MTIIEERLAALDSLVLTSGSHASWEHGACVMEAVSYVAGEPFSDKPKCASPVITSFLISWNDALPQESRQILKPLIPLVVGTRTSARDEETRAWMCTDWLARECAPALLRLAGFTGHAERLEQLEALTNARSAKAAQPALDAARTDADAARDAAWAAAEDAAEDAARAAARAAAWDAARDAAEGAAGAAARAAAWDAARDAAWAAAENAAWAAAWETMWAAAGATAGAAAWAAAGVAAGAAAWAAAAAEKGGDYVAQYQAAYEAAAAKFAEPVYVDTIEALQRSAYQLVERMCAVGRAACLAESDTIRKLKGAA